MADGGGVRKRSRVSESESNISENRVKLEFPQAGFMANPEAEAGAFISLGDESTADVVVQLTDESEQFPVLHMHSSALARSRYFATLLSERWNGDGNGDGNGSNSSESGKKMVVRLSMSHPFADYMQTLRLLYTDDFSEAITSVQAALSVLPVAAELLYDDCLTACLRFVEAVPWTRDEEQQVLAMINYLQLGDTSSNELLARLTPVEPTAVEKMLSELVYAATHTHQHAASVKAFVAKVLSSHRSKPIVRQVLDDAFRNGLKTVKDSVEDYSSPNVRGRHDEIEAMQRQCLHTAVVTGRHLLWLVERMIELKVADNAVLEWSEQSTFTANLKRAFMDDVWRNNVPGLPAVLLRCTCRLANAMVTGCILAPKSVRKKMVRDWLPVLVTSKESAVSANCNKQLHQDLEDVFLKLILTLPISDAQELLQQCLLSFASRSHDESSNLALAFGTWFRRASQEL